MSISGTKIAVIGLGAMGAALARSLLAAGAKVRVWNRSPEKSVAMQKEGAVACPTASEAIDGCFAVVVCLSNYAAWREIAKDETLREKLKGLLLIQLTGGTMTEVQEHAMLIAVSGAELIEGAILCFPEQIGTQGASIIIAGQKDVIEKGDPILRAMSPDITDLGENYTAPVVLGRAVISGMLGFLVGTINGAAICEAGGVPLSAFSAQVATNADLMQSEPLRLVQAIASGDTTETQASLATWAEGHVALLDVARKLEIETSFHNGIKAMFDKSLEHGLGDHDLSAMVQAFRLHSNH